MRCRLCVLIERACRHQDGNLLLVFSVLLWCVVGRVIQLSGVADIRFECIELFCCLFLRWFDVVIVCFNWVVVQTSGFQCIGSFCCWLSDLIKSACGHQTFYISVLWVGCNILLITGPRLHPKITSKRSQTGMQWGLKWCNSKNSSKQPKKKSPNTNQRTTESKNLNAK